MKLSRDSEVSHDSARSLGRTRPSLIEKLLPAQKISAEAQKERKAVHGQTLTALGSYWKGRKPLILVKACVWVRSCRRPGTPRGIWTFSRSLMAIDDRAFLRREPSLSPDGSHAVVSDAGLLRSARWTVCFTVRGIKEADWEALALGRTRRGSFRKAIEERWPTLVANVPWFGA